MSTRHCSIISKATYTAAALRPSFPETICRSLLSQIVYFALCALALIRIVWGFVLLGIYGVRAVHTVGLLLVAALPQFMELYSMPWHTHHSIGPETTPWTPRNHFKVLFWIFFPYQAVFWVALMLMRGPEHPRPDSKPYERNMMATLVLSMEGVSLLLTLVLPYIGIYILSSSFGRFGNGTGVEVKKYPNRRYSDVLSVCLSLPSSAKGGIGCVSSLVAIAASTAMQTLYREDNTGWGVHVSARSISNAHRQVDRTRLVVIMLSILTYYFIVRDRHDPLYIWSTVIPHARRRRLINLTALLGLWISSMASIAWRLPIIAPNELIPFSLSLTPTLGIICGLCVALWTAYFEPEEDIGIDPCQDTEHEILGDFEVLESAMNDSENGADNFGAV
ncbi:hypothetical protein C8R47DRAFT_1129998 [Mycena vitilis]|nr:hypothetical protein C8R47DRAFT_1129998 [Mycena vitilis]